MPPLDQEGYEVDFIVRIQERLPEGMTPQDLLDEVLGDIKRRVSHDAVSGFVVYPRQTPPVIGRHPMTTDEQHRRLQSRGWIE